MSSPTLTPRVSTGTRLMLVAPHPDDEALACGIILQRAVRAGAAIRVLYATDGDNNPWPQRVLDRTWRLGSRDRKRWGRLRRIEARAALRVMGMEPQDAQFLGLPDQGLTELLMRGCKSTVASLRAAVTKWQPNLLFVPSISDTHADHSALGVWMRLMHSELIADAAELTVWSYLVHGRSAAFSRSAATLSQSQTESEAKLTAIGCHKTQLLLSRRRFLRYAMRSEKFLNLTSSEPASAVGPLRSSVRDAGNLHLKLRFRFKVVPAAQPRLVLVGWDKSNHLTSLVAQLSGRSAQADLLNHRSGDRVGTISYRGNGFAADVMIPTTPFASASPLFLKIDRGGYLDRGGWAEINALSPALATPARSLRVGALT